MLKYDEEVIAYLSTTPWARKQKPIRLKIKRQKYKTETENKTENNDGDVLNRFLRVCNDTRKLLTGLHKICYDFALLQGWRWKLKTEQPV